MILVPACSGWVNRLERRISLLITGIIIIITIINTRANLTPIKEGVVKVAVVEEEIDQTKAEAEVEVVVAIMGDVIMADGVTVMPTVTQYTRKLMRR